MAGDRKRLGLITLLGLYAGTVMAIASYEAALPPLPPPSVQPMPELARQVMWADQGGEFRKPRRLGVVRSLSEIGLGRRAWPALLTASGAGRQSLLQTTFHSKNFHAHSCRRSLRIARWWTADQALDFLGNTAYFGNNITGLRLAANRYYGRPIESLSRTQLAVLVSTHRSPSAANPWRRRDRLFDFTRRLLARMGQPALTDERLGVGLLPPPDDPEERSQYESHSD